MGPKGPGKPGLGWLDSEVDGVSILLPAAGVLRDGFRVDPGPCAQVEIRAMDEDEENAPDLPGGL